MEKGAVHACNIGKRWYRRGFLFPLGALRGEADADYTLLYGRLAYALRPDHIDALLLNAKLLEELGQFGLAIEVYKRFQAPTLHHMHPS